MAYDVKRLNDSSKMINNIDSINSINAILATKGRRSWILHGNLKIYLRHGYHCLSNGLEILNCLDIANVENMSPGKGEFTQLLEQIEYQVSNCQNCNCIYIESIINSRLVEFFERRDYSFSYNSNILAPNMYKKFKQPSVA